MVQVLKRGEPPAEKVADITCENCHSILRVRYSEAEVKVSRDLGGYIKYVDWPLKSVKCPVCPNILYLEEYQFNKEEVA